jgi:hypothetical protein
MKNLLDSLYERLNKAEIRRATEAEQKPVFGWNGGRVFNAMDVWNVQGGKRAHA